MARPYMETEKDFLDKLLNGEDTSEGSDEE